MRYGIFTDPASKQQRVLTPTLRIYYSIYCKDSGVECVVGKRKGGEGKERKSQEEEVVVVVPTGLLNLQA